MTALAPRSTLRDAVDVRAADPERIGDVAAFVTSEETFAYLADLTRRQAGVRVPVAADVASEPVVRRAGADGRHEPAAFDPHVREVVLDSPEEEMVGPDARSIVATMQNPKAIRDRPVVELPRKAVGVHGDPATSDGAAQDAVTVSTGGGPIPASVAFPDLQPEPRILFHR